MRTNIVLDVKLAEENILLESRESCGCPELSLEPFPTAVRTLDALHLASIEFLRQHGQDVALATYDSRMLACARSLRIPIYKL